MNQGHLSDPVAQAALRTQERRVSDREAADWERLMSCDWGRRIAYRLVLERGRAMALSFEPAIKDGIAAALHTARNEGIREFALALGTDLMDLFPERWLEMHAEMTAARQAERAARRKALESSATTTHED